METIETDVLIIGGGGAAGMAAVEAAKYGLRVTLVDKGRFSRSGSTPVAATGVSMPLAEGDSPELHFKDVLRVGEDLCDRPAALACVEDAIDVLRQMEEIGVPIRKTRDGSYYQVTQAMGHSMPRNVRFDFERGDPMLILRREAAHRGVTIVDFVMIAQILTSGGRAIGALGLDRKGNWIRFLSRAVILGAGSATALYPHSSSSLQTTGDAVALALDAGARVIDMEFVELTLVPVVDGVTMSTGGIGVMVSVGAAYLNNRGERFMEKIDPVKKEAAPRYKVVRAVYKEIQEGRGPVICDLSDVPTEVVKNQGTGNLALMHKRHAAGLGTLKKQFEWGIAIHRLLGGSRIDAVGATDVPGLYAIGESAGGVHGAARLAGQAVLDCLVFGMRAGRAACKFAAEAEIPRNGDYGIPSEPAAGAMQAEELVDQVRAIMGSYVSVVRNAEGLRTAVRRLEDLVASGASPVSDNPWRPWEARNLALNALLIARAALAREESRGGHFREDFPVRDDARWVRHIGFSRQDGEIKMELVDVQG